MKPINVIKWKCLDCEKVFFSSENPSHNLDKCPICMENAIDHEKDYIRIIGNVERLD